MSKDNVIDIASRYTLSRDMMPKVISDFVFHISEDQQTPVDYAAVTSIVSIASLFGNSVKINVKRNNQWWIHCTLWGALIGEPTAGKSIALSAALRPFKECEKHLREKWNEQNGNYKFQEFVWSVKRKLLTRDLENQIKKDRLSEAQESFKKLTGYRKAPPRFVVNDITVESLTEVLRSNPKGLLMIQPELSGFISHLSRKENKSERCFYMQAYDGTGDFVCDRIGRGHVYVPKVTMSLLGTIQPTEIAHLVHSAESNETNDGFLQRIQMVAFPPPPRDFRWVDNYSDFSIIQAYHKLIWNIYQYSLQKTAIRFTDLAQKTFAEWVVEMKKNVSSCKNTTSFNSHKLKMLDTVAKLAFIFHACEHLGQVYKETLPAIECKSLRMAIRWSTYLLEHARRMYDLKKNN